MAVYVVLVSVIFQRGGPDYPLFILAAILPWKWFQTIDPGRHHVGLGRGTARSARSSSPSSSCRSRRSMAGIVNFAFGLIPLFALMLLFFRDRIELTLLLIPVVAVVQLVFNLALTILLAAVNVFYRDVGNLSRHVLRLWFYLSPALFSLDQLIAGDRVIPDHPAAPHAEPVGDAVHGVPGGHLRRTAPGLDGARNRPARVTRPPLPDDALLQARRAGIRQGPLMVDVDERLSAAVPDRCRPTRQSPSRSTASASSTASGSPARRRSIARS